MLKGLFSDPVKNSLWLHIRQICTPVPWLVQIYSRPSTVISTSRISHPAADYSAACPATHPSLVIPSKCQCLQRICWMVPSHSFLRATGQQIALSKAVQETDFTLFTRAKETYSEEFQAVFRTAKT